MAKVDEEFLKIISEKRYNCDPIEEHGQNHRYYGVLFGNTGLSLDVSDPTAWSLAFVPDTSDLKTNERIYTNGLLSILGIYRSVQWYKEKGIYLSKEGLVRGETNEKMHRFWLNTFNDLSSKSGINNIYTETGREGASYLFEIKYNNLSQAIERVEQNLQEEPDRKNIRFFDILHKAQKAWER